MSDASEGLLVWMKYSIRLQWKSLIHSETFQLAYDRTRVVSNDQVLIVGIIMSDIYIK